MSDTFAEGREAGGPREPDQAAAIRAGKQVGTKRPDALLRPQPKAGRQRELPPELVEQAVALGIDPATLAGSGGAPDRLALNGIDDTTGAATVLVSKGTVGDLGAAPTLGRSSYAPPRTSTVLDALEDFWDLSREKLIDVQQRLWRNGFYGEGDQPEYGRLTERDFDAYRSAVVLSAQSGKALLDEILDPTAEDVSAKAELSHREDIRLILDRVAPEAIGRRLSDDEAERIVSAWHAREEADFAAAGAGGEQPMSNEAFVESQLQVVAPGETEAQDFGERAQQFMDLLGSPV